MRQHDAFGISPPYARAVAAEELLARADLQFLLFDWLGIEKLFERDRFSEHSRDTVDAVLSLAEQIAREKFAPHNRRNDVEEPRFDAGRTILHEEVAPALRAAADAGLLSAAMDAEIGGLQLPHTVATAAYAWFHAANVASWTYALRSA